MKNFVRNMKLELIHIDSMLFGLYITKLEMTNYKEEVSESDLEARNQD